MLRKIGLVLVALLSFGSLAAHGELVTGTIEDWQESGPFQVIGDGSNSVTLWWSANTFDRGFFYGSLFTGDSDVAYATGVSDISEIDDASVFAFTNNSIGPNCDADCSGTGVGEFIVWRNINTGHYGVLRIDDIVGNLGPLSGTWWFQTDGTGNFAPVTDPETLLEELGADVAGVGPGRSLASKVMLAQTYLAVPDVESTCAMLNAFRNQVGAQRGKKLTVELADELTADAEAIQAAVGCN